MGMAFFAGHCIKSSSVDAAPWLPIHLLLHLALHHTHDRFISSLLFETDILYRTLHEGESSMWFIYFWIMTPGVGPGERLWWRRCVLTGGTWRTDRTETARRLPAKQG